MTETDSKQFDPKVYEFELFKKFENRHFEDEYKKVMFKLRIKLALETNNGRPVDKDQQLIDDALEISKKRLGPKQLESEIHSYVGHVFAAKIDKNRASANWKAGIEEGLPTSARD